MTQETEVPSPLAVERLWSPKEVARLLGWNINTVYRRCRLPAEHPRYIRHQHMDNSDIRIWTHEVARISGALRPEKEGA